MIGKVGKGAGSRGLCNYLLAATDHNGKARPRAQIIGGNMAGRTPQELSREFGALHQLRPGLGLHIIHVSLSAAPGDRELSDQEWAAIADHWAHGMHFQHWATISHGDHVHIALSRIHSDGGVVSDRHDWRRSEKLIREIEKAYGLTRVEPSHLLEPAKAAGHRKAPTLSEIALAEKGRTPTLEVIRDLVDAALEDSPSASLFIGRLEAAGVSVNANISDTGKLSGFSYELDDLVVTAKAMGRRYTLTNLQKSGLTYDKNRDLETCRTARDRAKSQATQRGIDRSRAPSSDPGAGRGSNGKADRSNSQGPAATSAAQQRSDRPAPETGRDINKNDSRGHNARPAGGRPATAAGLPAQKPDQGYRGDQASSLGGNDHRGSAIGRTPDSASGLSAAPDQSGVNGGTAGETESDYVGLDGDDPGAATRFLRKWAAQQRRLQSAAIQMSKSMSPSALPSSVIPLLTMAGLVQQEPQLTRVVSAPDRPGRTQRPNVDEHTTEMRRIAALYLRKRREVQNHIGQGQDPVVAFKHAFKESTQREHDRHVAVIIAMKRRGFNDGDIRAALIMGDPGILERNPGIGRQHPDYIGISIEEAEQLIDADNMVADDGLPRLTLRPSWNDHNRNQKKDANRN